MKLSEAREEKYVEFEQGIRADEKIAKLNVERKELKLKEEKNRLQEAIQSNCFNMAQTIIKRIIKLNKSN